MQTLINYLWSQSWQIAILALVIAAVTYILKNKSAHIRYLLWLLLVAKCICPPLLNVPLPLLPEQTETETAIFQPILNSEMNPVAEFQTPAESLQPTVVKQHRQNLFDKLMQLSITTWLTIIWAAGAGFFLIFTLFRATITQRWLIRNRKPLPVAFKNYVNGFFENIPVRNKPNIWLVDSIGQPFVWGIFRGGIYLPASFTKINDANHQNAVLAHELCHITRFDALINLLQIIAQSLFWFHPVVWWANKKIRAEREMCCDEIAIAQTAAEPSVFSSAILNTLITEHKAAMTIPSLAVAGPVKNIEERIKTIMKPNKIFHKKAAPINLLLIAALFIVIIPTSLALTTSPPAFSEVNYSDVEENIQFLTEIEIFKIGPESAGLKYFLMSLDDNITVLDETLKDDLETLLSREDPKILSRPRILQNNNTSGNIQIGDDEQMLIDFEILPVWLKETQEIKLSVKSLINDGQDIWQENKNFIIASGQPILLSQQTTDNEDSLLCLMKCYNVADKSFQKVESERKIGELSKAILLYANDYGDRLPDYLSELINYELDLQWFLQNIEYIGSGKTTNDDPDSAIAYDKELLKYGQGTNVLYLAGYMCFVPPKELKEIGIVKDTIMVEAQILEIYSDEDSEINLYLNEIQPDEKAVLLEEEQVDLLMKLSQADPCAVLLSAPRIKVLDNESAVISVGQEIPYVVDVNEKILDANGNPQSAIEYIQTGIQFDIHPHISPTNTIYLELTLKSTQVMGYTEISSEENSMITKNPIFQSTEIASTVSLLSGQTILNKIKIPDDKLTLILIKAENAGLAPVPASFFGKEQTSGEPGGYGGWLWRNDEGWLWRNSGRGYVGN